MASNEIEAPITIVVSIPIATASGPAIIIPSGPSTNEPNES
ncbi:unannotated protein [freshwater metagenome]|uniref:Unannotated protein n=1 Tax=freshwater metagenome TaxID=449393 RepID=A0A6J6BHN7_9ZZZZ